MAVILIEKYRALQSRLGGLLNASATDDLPAEIPNLGLNSLLDQAV